MKIVLLALFITICCFLPASAQARTSYAATIPTAGIDEYLKGWSVSAEMKSLLDDPSLLGKLIDHKNLSDFDEVPVWIKNQVISDDKKLQALAKRMEVIYKSIPEARQIKLVYFNNPTPFFALGNRSLLFISTTSFDTLSENEFAAAGFHEIAHLVFADVYWNLRRAGNANAVKQIEMNCDRFSFRMLEKVNVPTSSLEKLLRKMDKIERQGNRDETEAKFYPSLDDRLKNLKSFV